MLGLALTAAVLPLQVAAQAGAATVDDLRALFGDWTAETALANGYVADPFCVDGRDAGPL